MVDHQDETQPLDGSPDPDVDEEFVRVLRTIKCPAGEILQPSGFEQILDHEKTDDAGLLLAPPDDFPITSLHVLRMPIRLAHRKSLPTHVRIDWKQISPYLLTNGGTMDLGSLQSGKRMREVARLLFEQIPEIDGLFLSSSDKVNPIFTGRFAGRFAGRLCADENHGSLEMSRDFFREFHERSAFTGVRYRLEDYLSSLDASEQFTPRVRNDFATICEDLIFRVLSNFATEALELFGTDFLFGLDGSLPISMAPRRFGWFPDPFRFTSLGPQFLHAGEDVLSQTLARSLSKYGRYPVYVSDSESWRRKNPEKANVAVIFNSRAALLSPSESAIAYIDCLRNVLHALDHEGFAFDLITPDLMTTSEMTAKGGFQRHEEEYYAAVYPWPTVHTCYQWREINMYLQEGGKAIFCGPSPCCLTSGDSISEDEAKNIAAAHAASEDEIITSLDSMQIPREQPLQELPAPLICSTDFGEC